MGRWGGRSLKPITLPRPKHRPAQDDDDAIYGMVAVAGLQENGFGKFGPILAFLAKYLHFWPIWSHTQQKNKVITKTFASSRKN